MSPRCNHDISHIIPKEMNIWWYILSIYLSSVNASSLSTLKYWKNTLNTHKIGIRLLPLCVKQILGFYNGFLLSYSKLQILRLYYITACNYLQMNIILYT